jgi:hypothetical protein
VLLYRSGRSLGANTYLSKPIAKFLKNLELRGHELLKQCLEVATEELEPTRGLLAVEQELNEVRRRGRLIPWIHVPTRPLLQCGRRCIKGGLNGIKKDVLVTEHIVDDV